MESLLMLLETLDSLGGTLRRRALIQHLGFHLDAVLSLNLRYLSNGSLSYSPRLDSTIGKAKALGFLWESPAPADPAVEGFDTRDSDYHITPDGTVVLGILRGRYPELSLRIQTAISQLLEKSEGSAGEQIADGLGVHRSGLLVQRVRTHTLREAK